jgi:hypothetical protein
VLTGVLAVSGVSGGLTGFGGEEAGELVDLDLEVGWARPQASMRRARHAAR